MILLLACATKEPADTGAPGPGDSGADTADTAADTGETDSACWRDTAGAPACPEGPDGDGDGWTAEDGDCDDCDASLHPGAEELCDGLDQDCDGEPVAEGGCAEGVDLADYAALPGWTSGEEGYSVGVAFGSPGGPGEEDLVVVARHAYLPCDRDRVLYAYGIGRDMPVRPDHVWPALMTVVTWAGPDYFTVLPRGPMVDHDGDGVRELFLWAAPDTDTPGGVFLVPDRETGYVEGSYEELASAMWLEPDDEWDFAWYVEGTADLDGDRLYDIVISSPTVWDDDGVADGKLYVVRGRPDLAGEMDPAGEVVLRDDADGLWADWQFVWALPDLDGDGGSELMAEGSSAAGIADGGALLASDGAMMTDVFSVLAYPSEDVMLTAPYTSPGDLDGDGLPELVFGLMGDTDDDDCLYFASVAPPYAGGALDDVVQTLCNPGIHGTPQLNIEGTHDLDGDGLVDPVIKTGDYYPEYGDGLIFLRFLAPTTRLDGGRAELQDVGVVIDHGRDGDLEDLDFADLDDDGVPELLVDRTGDDTELIQILPNFVLPFDDPTRW